ncbi:unnamed protein product [Caenorhabditis bovis]|uniref:Major facilitator superfamily (MFS) profile domain-containing protein n=1 Tax=Caenorhabditis bovis TaxID=2654633 RepID=A0A8S1F1B2_9PELO|nr:unnamed protein product [Caenorhabditis bovis]
MFGFFCTTFMRMHLAITMTCMVNSTALILESTLESDLMNGTLIEEVKAVSDGVCDVQDGNNLKKVIVDYGGELVWTNQEQNLIFSGTFWGSIITVLPSMFFINRHSPRLVLQAAIAVYIGMTILTPYLALNYGPYPVFASRFIMGLGEGFILPTNNALLANWFPSAERSTAISLFTTGNQLAGAGGNPIAASLCASSYGWESVFYFIGGISIIWSVIWTATSSNQPSKCKTMNKIERQYLEANVIRRSNKTQKDQNVPYGKILRSPAFWAQLQCQFVINSVVTLFQIYLPSYFKDVLHLGVIANGTYTSVPNIVNFAIKIVWSILIDRAKEKKKINPTVAVKLSQSVANFGAATALICIAFFVDCTNPTLAFIIFCFMYGCMGTFVSGFYTSLLSLAPRYTATMSSISVFCAMMGRLLTPAIVGLIKKEGNLAEWQMLFLLSAFANVMCGVIFLIFGSGELQDWGKEDEEKEMQKIEEKQNLKDENVVENETFETPEIVINEITLTTEEREEFKRRIREDSIYEHWFYSLTAVLCISAAPCVLLFFIPAQHANGALLNILLAFGAGGLLGDAILHIIPHALHGHEHQHNEIDEHNHTSELKVGVFVILGLLVFMMIELIVRIIKNDDHHNHAHEMVHLNQTKDNTDEKEQKPENIKVTAYLNLAADFIHNLTDGLAIGASFSIGTTTGLLTTSTVFLHELPHEVGDFAILVQAGFSKWEAIRLQLVTALGAVTGCLIALLVSDPGQIASGTHTSWIMPFTAGGFIYIATVSVIPELLEIKSSNSCRYMLFIQSLANIFFICLGVAMMYCIAIFE